MIHKMESRLSFIEKITEKLNKKSRKESVSIKQIYFSDSKNYTFYKSVQKEIDEIKKLATDTNLAERRPIPNIS